MSFEGQQLPNPGSSIHYVSVGVERNSKGINVDVKASAWYHALPGESSDEVAVKIGRAEAASATVARLTAASAQSMIGDDVSAEDIHAFTSLISSMATHLCEQIQRD